MQVLGEFRQVGRAYNDAVFDNLLAVEPERLLGQHGVGMVLAAAGHPERQAQTDRVIAQHALVLKKTVAGVARGRMDAAGEVNDIAQSLAAGPPQ